jgi:hypothetical protein
MDTFPPELLLDDYPRPLRTIANDLRRIMRAVAPTAVERVRIGWRTIGYDIPVGRGRRTSYFAFIWPEQQHIHFGFVDGTLLADPDRMLKGEGITKKARWVTYRAGDRPSRRQLAPFIREAAAQAQLSRGERLALLLDRT